MQCLRHGIFSGFLLPLQMVVFFFIVSGNEAEAQKVKLELASETKESIILAPVDITFTLTNLSENTIKQIPLLNPSPDVMCDRIRICVSRENEKYCIKKPVLKVCHADTFTEPECTFDLRPRDTHFVRITLTMDWALDKPIFPKPGPYTIQGFHSIPGIGVVESNKIEISFRGPETSGETRALDILKDIDILSCFYDPDLIYLYNKEENPTRFSLSVLEIFNLDQPTMFKEQSRNALKYWKEMEIEARKDMSPGSIRMGLDKLGLTDADLDK